MLIGGDPSVFGMNLIVLAASGRTGLALARKAVERGHTVTAIARDPSRITVEHVRKVAGDVTDPASIAAVVDEDSVVLSGLGANRAGTLAQVAAGRMDLHW